MRKMIVLFLCVLMLGATAHAQEEEYDNLILAWLGDGETPTSIVNRGDIVLMDGQGEIIRRLTPVGANDTVVSTCSEQPTAPNGEYHTFFVGSNTTGNLYIIQPNAEVTTLSNTHPYACLGMGSFVWQTDSQSFAYINYNNTENIPYGQLNIRSTATIEQTSYTFDNITSFDYQPNTLSLIEVYRDTLRVQHGTLEEGVQEVGRIFSPSETCPFRTATVEQININTLAVITGYRCNNINRWDLYWIDIPSRTTNRILQGRTGQDTSGNASYSAQSPTTGLISTSDGQGFYFTYPDGVLGNYSAMVRPLEMRRPLRNVTEEMNALVIMPRIPLTDPSAPPVLSRDGRFLALSQKTADDVSTQFIYDLTTFNKIMSFGMGSRGDLISSSTFTPDGETLYLIVGGTNGNRNALLKIDINTETTQEVARGSFLSPLVLSPDGNHGLVIQQEVGGVNNLPYVDLRRVDLNNGQSEVVFSGSDLGADGRFIRWQFAVPLFWLKAS